MTDGYYWARHAEDGTRFVAYREGDDWFCAGVAGPINDAFSESQIICPVVEPVN